MQCMCAINMHYYNFNINIRNLLFVKSTLNCIIFFQLIPYKEIKFSKFFHQRKLFQIVPWGAGSTGSPVDCVLSTPASQVRILGALYIQNLCWWIYNRCEAVIRHVKPCLSGSGYTQIWTTYCGPNHQSSAPPHRGALSIALGPNSAPTATIGCSIRSAPPRR